MGERANPRVSLNEIGTAYIKWRYPVAMNDAERVRMAVNTAMFHDLSVLLSDEDEVEIAVRMMGAAFDMPGDTLADAVMDSDEYLDKDEE